MTGESTSQCVCKLWPENLQHFYSDDLKEEEEEAEEEET